MIDLALEQLRPLSRASADVPGRPHVSTVIRWAMRGIKGVRLETVIIGGRRYTSLEAIHRFVARLNEPDALSIPLSEQCERRLGKLDEELDARGIT